MSENKRTLSSSTFTGTLNTSPFHIVSHIHIIFIPYYVLCCSSYSFLWNMLGCLLAIHYLMDMQVTKEVIEAVENVGFFVRACISDMGSSNQDMWKFIGIRSTRENITNFITHPTREGCKLYFMADPPHLLKNIRNCLLAQTLVLSDQTVQANTLPSNIVSLQHVRDLISMQKGMEFKVAPNLKQIHVDPGKFQKMKVNIAAQVLSHSTATALRLCVAHKLLPEAALTTAWFLQSVNDWFDAMNARFPLASLFKSSTSKIEMLQMFRELFLHLHFGGRDSWKPIQTGVRLSISTVLDLFNDLVANGNYKYLMTGRMTQDCVENLFSQIRSRGDTHPKPVHLRHCIRLISLSQYMHVSPDSSYESDTDTYFLDFLKGRAEESLEVTDEDDETSMAEDCSALLPMSALEGDVLYTIAGWTVFKEKSKIQQCPACLSAILGDQANAPEQSLLTVLKSFSTGAGLTHPSKTILEVLIAAESLFQKNRANLSAVGNVNSFLMQGFSNQFAVNNFPTCHNVLNNIVHRYFRLRIHMLAKKMTGDFRNNFEEVQHGSKSAHCRTKVK